MSQQVLPLKQGGAVRVVIWAAIAAFVVSLIIRHYVCHVSHTAWIGRDIWLRIRC